jgi:signal transduction histidine kinase
VRNERGRWTGLVILGLVLLLTPFVRGDTRYGSQELAWTGVGLLGAAALVALVGYRGSHNPTHLYAGVGAGVIAAQALSSALLLFSLGNQTPIRLNNANVYGWLAASATLAACLLLAAPWHDRRGQPPPRARRTVVVAFGVVVVVEAVALLVPSQRVPLDTFAVRAAIALIALASAVAGVRLLVNVRGSRTTFGWLAAAAFAGAILVGVTLLFIGTEPILARVGVRVRGSMALCEGAFLLAGTLNAIQLERTRLRRTSDRAAEVMEGRAEIASIVAHDVRGPAGTIRSVAGSLRTSYQRLGDPERLEFVGMIEQESLRLLRVADQMSLGLKADAGTLPFNLEDRDVEGVVLQGVHEADAGPREVRTHFTPDLRARIDARWTAEAVRQGIENALRFSPADTPIDVRTRVVADAIQIEIEDHGPGIPPEMHEQVFEKFIRWRPRGYEDTPGSGLGLFVTRQIAREQGGDATIEGGPDGGTILQIRLPREGAERG